MLTIRSYFLRYLVRRLSLLLGSLFVIITLTFCLMHAAPGNPFSEEQPIPEEIIRSLARHYGLDRPWYVQYAHYLKGMAKGDLGPSFKYPGRSVTGIIKESFPVSFILGGQAFFCALVLGGSLGMLASLSSIRHSLGWIDRLVLFSTIIALSIPSFILATFLQYVLAIQLDLLPLARWGSFQQTILPTIALAALPSAFIARLLRANMLEVLQKEYIQTAKAKGLGPGKILLRHALRNALLPLIPYLGTLAASIFTGSFAVEKIFGIPGLGQWFVLSIINRDYTLIMGVTVFYSVLLMLFVLCADLLSSWIDPRLTHICLENDGP